MFDTMTAEEIDALPYEIIGDSADREDWLVARSRLITASDVAAILGLSPYKSALELWQEKRGDAPDREQTPLMIAGLKLEPIILDYFNAATGRKAVPAQKLLRSKKWPWLGATLDAWDAENRGPVELKFCREYSADLWSDSANPLYVPQLMTQILVTGAAAGSFGVLVGGWDFRWMDLPLDAMMAHEILRESHKFARQCRSGEPPGADGSKSAKEALDRQWPAREDVTVSLSHKVAELVTELDQIDEDVKSAQARKALIRNLVIEEMKGADLSELPDGSSFTYRSDKNDRRTLRRKKA